MSQALADQVKAEFGDQVYGVFEQHGAPESDIAQWVVDVTRDATPGVLKFCREQLGLTYLADLTAIDYLLMPTEHPERFAVVYVLRELLPEDVKLLVVRAWVPESDPSIETATPLWTAANWFEREAYDMFGITFKNHPNHIRILMPENFDAYPLRKDFPSAGVGYRDRFYVINRENA